jgi:hypothetical protein
MRQFRIVALVASLSLAAAACGGIERDSGPGDAGFAPVGYGGFTDVLPATGGSGTTARCGNGILDPGESCDGALFGGATCASVTLGAKVEGTLTCSGCKISIVACGSGASSGGAPGIGGFPGVGGLNGAGGLFGVGGDAACYNAGGVAYPTGTCSTGDTAQKACYGEVSGTQVGSLGCELDCSCANCASVYARCASDGGCNWLLPCAVGAGCTTMEACYNNGCGSITDRAGGLGSIGSVLADAALACMWKAGCAESCTAN